jgi:bifunctional non-homologous end joining protein LigD
MAPLPLGRWPSPFADPDFIVEVKLDGFRAHAFVDGETGELVSRNGRTFRRFAPLAAEVAKSVKARSAVLDGEVVCLDDAGRAASRPSQIAHTTSDCPRRASPHANTPGTVVW